MPQDQLINIVPTEAHILPIVKPFLTGRVCLKALIAKPNAFQLKDLTISTLGLTKE